MWVWLSEVLVLMLSRIESYTCSPRFAHSLDRLSFVTFILAFLLEGANKAGGARSVTLTLLFCSRVAPAFVSASAATTAAAALRKMAAADSGDEKR